MVKYIYLLLYVHVLYYMYLKSSKIDILTFRNISKVESHTMVEYFYKSKTVNLDFNLSNIS